ncbi:hypothetical protein D3C72_2344850 [compost metagenome]
MPPIDEPVADDVGGQRANGEHHHHGKDHTQTGDVKAQPLVGLPGGGQDVQGLVERADDPVQHPQGDDQGHQDQQAGQEPFAQ